MTKTCVSKQVCCVTRRETFDWLTMFILLILGVYLGSVRPHIKCIPGIDKKCSDSELSPNPNLQYPLTNETVPIKLLLVIIFIPWLFYFLINLIFIHWKRSSSVNAFQSLRYFLIQLKCMLLSVSLALVITMVIKLGVGQERPYFQAVYGTDDEYSARISFPSGHASAISTNALLSICMLYANKIVMKNSGSRSKKSDDSVSLVVGKNIGILFFGGHLWYILRDFQLLSVLLCFLPCVIGVWCGCTRITDYRHFAVDVLAGFCVGIFVAFLMFYVFEDELFFDGILNGNENSIVYVLQNNAGNDNKSLPLEIEVKGNTRKSSQ